MHVSILAGLPLTPSAYSEHKEHVAALDIHLCGIAVVERSPRQNEGKASSRTKTADEMRFEMRKRV
jgi:hypothetical protein